MQAPKIVFYGSYMLQCNYLPLDNGKFAPKAKMTKIGQPNVRVFTTEADACATVEEAIKLAEQKGRKWIDGLDSDGRHSSEPTK